MLGPSCFCRIESSRATWFLVESFLRALSMLVWLHWVLVGSAWLNLCTPQDFQWNCSFMPCACWFSCAGSYLVLQNWIFTWHRISSGIIPLFFKLIGSVLLGPSWFYRIESSKAMLVTLRFSSLSDRVDAPSCLRVAASAHRRIDVLTSMLASRLTRTAT